MADETSTPEEKDSPRERAKKLGFLGKERSGEPTEGFGKLTQGLLAGVISLIMALMVVFLAAPTKEDLQSLDTDLDSRFEVYTGGLDTQFGTLNSDFDSKFTTYQTTIGEGISGLNSKVNDLERSLDSRVRVLEESIVTLSGLEERVDTAISRMSDQVDLVTGSASEDLEAHLAFLDTRVAELEAEVEAAEEEEDTFPVSPISIRVSDIGGVLVPGTDGTTLTAPIKLTLTKTAGRSIEDITIFVELQTQGIPNIETVRLTGSGVSWRTSGWELGGEFFYGVQFMNVSWGLNMHKETTKKNIYLTLTVTGSGYLGEEYAFQIDAEVDDWSY